MSKPSLSRTGAAVFATVALVACLPGDGDAVAGDDPTDSTDPVMLAANTPDADTSDANMSDLAKLHPLEKYCLTLQLGGMMTGEWVECSRKFGHERYELQNTEIKIGPITQSDNKRVVYKGSKIYTIPENGPAMVADNPMYEGLVQTMQNTDPMELSQQMLSGMGFTPNGETMEIVGKTCNVAAGQMGTMCMTDDGLTLYVETMGQTRTATAIDLDSGGDDANYNTPANAQQAPDLSNILQGLGN